MSSQNSLWHSVAHSIRALFRRKKAESELDSELRFHLESQIESNIRAGMSPEAARQSALREFGAVALAKEECRDERGTQFLEQLWQDVRFGLRMFRKNPGFTAVAVLTLALGIGTNTAIFSLLNAVMIRQLPVKNPEQLVRLYWTSQKPIEWNGVSGFVGCDADQLPAAYKDCSFSYSQFDLFRKQAHSSREIIAFGGPGRVKTNLDGAFDTALTQFVSGEFFSALGVLPAAGRMIAATDEGRVGASVAVISFNYWQTKFSGSADAIGRTIILQGMPFTIVGVAEKTFFGLQPVAFPDIYVPFHSDTQWGRGWWGGSDTHTIWLSIIVRLKPGASAERVRAELGELFRGSLAVDRETPISPDTRPDIAVMSAARGLAGLRSRFSTSIEVLMGIAALVLLIACANIANLLLVRSSARRNEIAVRLAVGASRARLFRQFLAESAVLALLGGTAGLLFAIWSSRVLAAVLFAGVRGGVAVETSLNIAVFASAALIAIISAILFGVMPALIVSNIAPAAALKSGNSTSKFALGSRSRLGQSLVSVQMALALILLIGAGLFLRTLIKLETVDPGFQKQHLLTALLAPKEQPPTTKVATSAGAAIGPNSTESPNGARTPDQDVGNFELQHHLAAIPGVVSVTWSTEPLLAGYREGTRISLASRDDVSAFQVDVLRVGPHFFETMGIPITVGRSIQFEDFAHDATAAWVNQTLAKQFYSSRSPIGDHIPQAGIGGIRRTLEIVGIVGDVKLQTVRSEIHPTVYVPSRTGAAFELRTSGDADSVTATVRSAIETAAPNLMITSIKSQVTQVNERLTSERTMAHLSATFGLLALILAAIGTYGVLAYSVARRTGEIAIRMSLGAMPRDILRLLLTEGLRFAAIGIGVGLTASYWLTRLLTSFLFNLSPLDGPTFGVSAFVLLAAAILACWIPARRATRVDPMTALRNE